MILNNKEGCPDFTYLFALDYFRLRITEKPEDKNASAIITVRK